MTDVEEVHVSEEQRCSKGMSERTQEFPSQLFAFGGPPRYADDGDSVQL